MIGNCPAMQAVYTRIRKTAPADVTVLIQGESGTGKELVARALHQQSRRAAAPLICVNCAAIPETLIESELFGHEKGAFTGASAARTGLVEAADGGTLFLDEIGELPLDAQARLLRVLQEGEIRKIGSVETRHVDVRLIAATHRDLYALSRTGGFRLDLYYRLNVMQIDLPPLRDREDDILEIADVLLEKACRRHQREGLKLSRAARRVIRDCPWPGNVRELENALERGVILAEGHLIHPDDLGLGTAPRPGVAQPSPSATGDEPQATAGAERPDDEEEDLSLEDYFQHFVLEHQDQMSRAGPEARHASASGSAASASASRARRARAAAAPADSTPLYDQSTSARGRRRGRVPWGPNRRARTICYLPTQPLPHKRAAWVTLRRLTPDGLGDKQPKHLF